MARRLPWLAAAAYGALLWACSPAWPDDWDGVGFVASIRDFDMGRFHPHPPGYPVYVALLRAAAVLTGTPMRACALVAAGCGAATVALTWHAVRRWSTAKAAWVSAALVATTPLVFRSCSGVGSEAPALAFLAAGAWALAGVPSRSRSAPLVLGLVVGLGLGVRLSWAPAFLATLLLLPSGARLRAWTAASAATACWVAPLVVCVGPARLWALYAQHFAGHAERWGGTVLTEPGTRRLAWLARDALVDGLGAGADALGCIVALLLVAAVILGVVVWRAHRWRGWKGAAIATLPYLVWVALGQNLRDQPRHVLPLVAVIVASLGLAASRSRPAMVTAAALAVALTLRTAQDARARRTIAPPAQQLVELVRSQAAPQDIAVFGVSSIRFFEDTELSGLAFPAGALGDVQVRLTRLDRLPARVWVTSEVDATGGSPWPLVPVATLCRPPRIDRRAPCLDVREWRLPFLKR